MKTIFFIFLVAFSAHSQVVNSFYISTNVASPLAGINKSSAALNALTPLISNLEYGVNLNGIWQHNYQLFELRCSYGRSNPYNRIPQLQLGYMFLVRDYIKKNQSSFYVGAHMRYWDYYNTLNDSQRHSLTASLSIGFFKRFHHFLLDFRVQQPFLIFTQTNIPHSKAAMGFNFSPMPKLSPVLPFLSLNIGYAF